MDRYDCRQSSYQPCADDLYLDLLHQIYANECGSAYELREYHRRKACLDRDRNYSIKAKTARTVEECTASALHQCRFPSATANTGKENAYRQEYGRYLQNQQPKPRPGPSNLATESHVQQQCLRTGREQHGYLDFDFADQKMRATRRGFSSVPSHRESIIPQTTIPPTLPEPTTYLVPRTCAPNERPAQQIKEQLKAPQQQTETPVCGRWVRDYPKDVLLNAWARRETGQRQLAQQQREQQRVQLPTAKPGNLHPGPSRISMPSARITHNGSMERDVMLSAHLNKLASSEAYRKYQEERVKKLIEGQREANAQVLRSEPPGTASVRQLLASVNKTPDQTAKTAQVEVAKTERAENDALGSQSQRPHNGVENAFEATRKRVESFWYEYGRNHPTPRQSNCTHSHPSLDSSSTRPILASPDHSIDAANPAHRMGTFQRDVPRDSSRTNNFRAEIEAIDKASGCLFTSPKTALGQDGLPLLHNSIVSTAGSIESCAADDASVSVVIEKEPSVEGPEVNMSPLPVPPAGKTDMSSATRANEGTVDKAVETAPLGDLDTQWEWEDVDDILEDDEWSDVEEDLVVDDCASDAEWNSDVVRADSEA